MSTQGWIGVDLDGTLAHYDGWKGHTHIGAPIPAMVDRVKGWIAEGQKVKIFTARVAATGNELNEVKSYVAAWCSEHIGAVLEITNVKDYGMIQLWDDRAIQVESNTARVIG
jgi:hypothetical protein